MATSTKPRDSPSPKPHSVVVKTPRLILRNYIESDAADMFHLRGNPENLKYINIGDPISVEDTRNWIRERHADPISFSFAVLLREDPSKVIGSVGGIRTPEFGYMLDSPYWGKGYATEAVRASIDAYWLTYPDGMPILEEEQRQYIQCMVDPRHEGSLAVLRKLGFQKVGDMPDHNGVEAGLSILKASKDDWKASMRGRPQIEITSDAENHFR